MKKGNAYKAQRCLSPEALIANYGNLDPSFRFRIRRESFQIECGQLAIVGHFSNKTETWRVWIDMADTFQVDVLSVEWTQWRAHLEMVERRAVLLASILDGPLKPQEVK